jgi:hypothetical protein
MCRLTVSIITKLKFHRWNLFVKRNRKVDVNLTQVESTDALRICAMYCSSLLRVKSTPILAKKKNLDRSHKGSTAAFDRAKLAQSFHASHARLQVSHRQVRCAP